MKTQTENTTTLRAIRTTDGIGVRDMDDGLSTWWPSEEAASEITATSDPEQAAVEMCRTSPMRGTWSN